MKCCNRDSESQCVNANDGRSRVLRRARNAEGKSLEETRFWRSCINNLISSCIVWARRTGRATPASCRQIFLPLRTRCFLVPSPRLWPAAGTWSCAWWSVVSRGSSLWRWGVENAWRGTAELRTALEAQVLDVIHVATVGFGGNCVGFQLLRQCATDLALVALDKLHSDVLCSFCSQYWILCKTVDTSSGSKSETFLDFKPTPQRSQGCPISDWTEGAVGDLENETLARIRHHERCRREWGAARSHVCPHVCRGPRNVRQQVFGYPQQVPTHSPETCRAWRRRCRGKPLCPVMLTRFARTCSVPVQDHKDGALLRPEN